MNNYKLNLVLILSILIILISNLRILLAALVFVYLIMNKGLIKKILAAFFFILLFIIYSYFMQVDRLCFISSLSRDLCSLA